MASIRLFLVCISFLFNFSEGLEEDCTDIDGKPILHGLIYVPGPNVCTMCVCYHSEPMWCKTMFCNGPPFLCKEYKVGKTCCQFECLDPPTERPPTMKELQIMKERWKNSASVISNSLVLSFAMYGLQLFI